jgi:hypothetical protein
MVPPNLDHGEDDLVVDDDPLTFLAWDDDHGGTSLMSRPEPGLAS